MSRKVADQALDFAFSFGDKEVQLGFFGGEPLLQWDTMQYASNRARETAAVSDVTLKQTLTTNAIFLTAEKAEWLAERDFYLGVSIDGNQAMHDITRPFPNGKSSFESCLKGLRRVLPLIPDLEIIVVVDPANVTHLADGVRFLIEQEHVKHVAVNPNFSAVWNEDALASLKHEFGQIGEFYLQWYRANTAPQVNFIDSKIITRLKNGYSCGDKCNFGEKEIAVAPSGNIYPCERLVGEDPGGPMCIGTVSSGFDDKKRSDILAKRGGTNAECATCQIKNRCMNWCCCINYALTGHIDQTDGIVCFHERLATEVADRVANALYEEHNPAFLSRFYHEDFQAPAD